MIKVSDVKILPGIHKEEKDLVRITSTSGLLAFMPLNQFIVGMRRGEYTLECPHAKSDLVGYCEDCGAKTRKWWG